MDPTSNKLWFRIVDYTGATRLLDAEWDRPPSAVVESEDVRPQTAALTGAVRLAETGDLLVGASVAVLTGPNDQRGPILTDENGQYGFDRLPAGELTLIASGPRVMRRQLTVTTQPDETTVCDIELKAASATAVQQIKVTNLEVTIADEATFTVVGKEPMTLEQYLDYSCSKIAGYVPDWNKLRALWQEPDQRRTFLQELEQMSIHVDVLAEVLDHPEADQFDLLAHLAYDRPLRSRAERAAAFQAGTDGWLNEQTEAAREVILALVEKYVHGGLEEMTDPSIFRVSPFREMGEICGVLRRFDGDPGRLRQAIDETQRRLYAV